MAATIVVPQLGESVVEARVARWLKRVGEAVAPGEPVVELETEKIDLEVPAERAGVLAEISRAEGSDVKVGEVLGVVDESAAAAPSAAGATPTASGAGINSRPTGVRAAAEAGPSDTTPVTPPADRKGRISPTARKVAASHAIDATTLAGTGEAGRVLKRDVEGYVDRQQASPQPHVARGAPGSAEVSRPVERVRMSKRRLTIARNLVQAQHTAAMLTTFNDVDMAALMSLRERHKQSFRERHGVGLGIASFFVKASVAALRDFPRLNAEIEGDEMILKGYYDIGIAVGAPQGLVVPVLRDADARSFAEIEQGIRSFARKAEDGTLSLDDLRGGTFTITNGGVFGSLLSTPILNPPQVGILGLHKIVDRPIAIAGRVEIRPMMYVALTYDHRIVDGMEAVQFLVRIKELVEDPGRLLLEG